jgi:hypothetical protein
MMHYAQPTPLREEQTVVRAVWYATGKNKQWRSQMPFVRTKVVKGRTYRSLEERYREGGKVKSRYIRSLPAGDFAAPPGGADESWLRRQFPRTYGLNWDAIAREEIERQDREVARTTAHLEELHALYGLNLGPSTPVEVAKPAPTLDLADPAAVPQGAPANTGAMAQEAPNTDAAPEAPDAGEQSAPTGEGQGEV